MKLNNHGHTLTELLIALMVISIIGSITLISLYAPFSAYERNRFISQLENDLYYAQQLAISNGAPSVFFINTSRNLYAIKQNNQFVYEQPFNITVSFERGSLGIDDIKFLSNGNISKPGTLFMYIDNQRYALVFLLGKGRFYIEER
ncbi:competence type IV pilus minor pilin ComGD [Alkalihalobacterium alkalinitrilicum]|uniref:competence type IV pilus minor pilin ComGD n=1 Tax=Alkalihalobacterium alkalinitrilicum TaxID=427920 RepID=UPI0009948FC0|nr:competence type IV pilus minor pilin ComGD [Alkalihalobacterium alkalinitrilicum]